METTNAPRQCGGCTMCCKILGIDALSKPVNVWCPHCAPGRGCKIYAQRPAECRTFACRWLIDTNLPDEWKPDRSKFVIFPDENPDRVLVHVDPGTPDAWRREPYQSRLRQKAAQSLPTGGSVIVVLNGQSTMLLPKGEVFLGVVKENDKVAVTETVSPTGTQYAAEVIRSPDPV